MRILSCPETSKGEFIISPSEACRGILSSNSGTMVFLDFHSRLYSNKNWRGPSDLNLWNPGCPAYAFSEKKNWDFLVAWEKKLGARAHWVLLEVSNVVMPPQTLKPSIFMNVN